VRARLHVCRRPIGACLDAGSRAGSDGKLNEASI